MFECCLSLLYYLAFGYLLYFTFLKPNPLPLEGIYSQPGKWFPLKYFLMSSALKLRKWRASKKPSSGGGSGYGVKSKSDPAEMDKVQPLSKHPKAIDAVYFNSSNKDGWYFICATARRPANVVQTALHIRVPDLGVLVLQVHPDTTLTADKPDSYAAGGLSIRPLEPMKTWEIKFEGQMRLLQSEDNRTSASQYVVNPELVNVKFEVLWVSCTPYFDFDTDMDPSTTARAIALEPWSSAYFKRLEDSHQTHYEQFGHLQGTFKIEHKDSQGHVVIRNDKVNLTGVRDHSYGHYREWKYFHRYGLQFFHLADGSCINVGIVSMPRVTMSRLELGYVMKGKGLKVPITSVNLPLWKLGEFGEPPEVFEFDFTAAGQNYHVEVEVIDSPIFYLGEESESKVYERMSRFLVNGTIKGWGCSEFQYRNLKGKVQSITDTI